MMLKLTGNTEALREAREQRSQAEEAEADHIDQLPAELVRQFAENEHRAGRSQHIRGKNQIQPLETVQVFDNVRNGRRSDGVVDGRDK
jgi:hypothetical protein